MKKLKNLYIGGVATGILLFLSVLFFKKYFGASTSFVRLDSVFLSKIGSSLAETNSYFKKYPVIDWQILFVIGIAIGAFISSKINGNFKIQAVPDTWKELKGTNKGKRFLFAFIGGAVSVFGARLAGGCPSGHGISGIAQLSIGSMLSLAFFIIGGLVTAKLFYKRER